ncbi:Tn3 family transposase [Pseudomonadota bacterium]
MKRQKRLKILTNIEIANLYNKPQFTDGERSDYFSLTPAEKLIVKDLRLLRSKVSFILKLGYFKAKHLFFDIDIVEIKEDVNYIVKTYFDNKSPIDLNLNKRTELYHKSLILKLYNYHYYTKEELKAIKCKAEQVAKISSKPIYIFREIIHYLTENHILLLGYSSIQKIIGQSLNNEQRRLVNILQNNLTKNDLKKLDSLLNNLQGLYEITLLKHEPKNFTLYQIKNEINKSEQIKDLYYFAKQLLPQLEISNESVKYYASLVSYYSVYKLKRFDKFTTYTYLICFIYYRYQTIKDNLINSLIYHVRKFYEQAKEIAKEKVYEFKIENNKNMRKVAQILNFFLDDNIIDTTPFFNVRTKAFKILNPDELNLVTSYITTKATIDENSFRWNHIDKLAHQFKLNLRLILPVVDFVSSSKNDPLIEAVNFLKTVFAKEKPLKQYSYSQLPTEFIADNLKRYLYVKNKLGKKELSIDRYEFAVYRTLRNALEAGDVFCTNSVRFRSLEEDLLNKDQMKDKARLIETAGLTALKQPITKHILSLQNILETLILDVNKRIATGENKYFQIKKCGKQPSWTLQYPENVESINHSFFKDLEQVDISSILQFVNSKCNFMDEFDHVLGRYAKKDSDLTTIIATIIAWGTNMGLGKMGEISDIGFQKLSWASDNFIRLETLHKASRKVSNAIAELPIFEYYDINDSVHSSSDGQKFETRLDTINSRYSPKYFGLKKGVSSYSLVANNIPINAKIIGANEHESHFVFDILYNNMTDIQPEIHSTDSHGTNEINFAILHLFGYQFAPRYRDLKSKIESSLCGFKNLNQYDDNLFLKPVKKINSDLIIDEWENIERIMLSLAFKVTTQSNIVGKLSSYARTNKTKKALWEYDNIIKSIHMLNYIDSPMMRTGILQALNRVELYHKLRRAISYANFGRLRFKTEYEQQIWSECSRLIANCIVYYNSAILSNLITQNKNFKRTLDINTIKQISPIAWNHINLFGRYEFDKEPQFINIEEISKKMMNG